MDVLDISRLSPHLKGNTTLSAIYDDIQRMPRLLRPLAYGLTALPAPGSAMPAFRPVMAGVRDLALTAAFATVAGVSATAAAQGMLPFLTGPLSFYAALGVTGRLRRASVGHTHEAGHGVVTHHLTERGHSQAAAERVTRIIMDVASAFSLTTNGDDYREAHNAHHDRENLGTVHDPDGETLKADGFWRGVFTSRAAFYRKLALALVNPAFHLRKLGERLHSNLLRGKAYRRAMGAGMVAALAGSALVLPLPAWIMAVGLPWTVLYNAAALLQVLTKHTYGHDQGAETLRQEAARCHERIPYHFMPRIGLFAAGGAMAWAKWIAHLLLNDIPVRLAVLDSSMVGHGFHHTAWPSKKAFDDWTNTVPRMVAHRSDDDARPDGMTQVLAGFERALARQARFMARRRRA